MNRILVIRGGAIGDFILTLPTIKVLRDANPNSHIEILGYKQIAALAENRFYAQRVRSIESTLLARFFAKDTDLPAELAQYFAKFDLIVSYLYDPDEIFETNLKRSGQDRSAKRRIRRGEEQFARSAAISPATQGARPANLRFRAETPSLGRRSTSRERISRWINHSDRRAPSRQRKRTEELAAPKLDRCRKLFAEFKERRLPSRRNR